MEARGITKVFGGLVAVNSVDFDIPERSIVSLIGPNGAGKTTFFNMVSGLYPVTSGTFRFMGRNVTTYKAHRRAQMGIGRTFQNIRLFDTMSAQDNVLSGMHTRLKSNILGSILAPRARGVKSARPARRPLISWTSPASKAGRSSPRTSLMGTSVGWR